MREKGPAFCWQTFSLGLLINVHMTHRATVLTPCLKGQWGWEKPTGQQAGKEWKKLPNSALDPTWRVTSPNVTLLQKPSPLRSEKDKSYRLFPKAWKDGWKVHLWWKQDFISQGFQIQSATPCEEGNAETLWGQYKGTSSCHFFHCTVHTTIYLININSNLILGWCNSNYSFGPWF